MPDSLKCPCAACGTNIEFPAEYAGQEVACPSCDTQTVPALPAIPEPAPPPPPPRRTGWRPPPQDNAAATHLELKSLSCPNCGSRLPVPKGTHEIKCDYCGTEGIRVIRPIAIGNRVKREGASHDDQQRFQNLVTVLSKSMLAGNYREAYDYCNKVLEIDPESAAIWENKAICAYWKATSDGLIDEAEAREIATYLDAASDLDPHSATLRETRLNIAYMISALARGWMSATKPDTEGNRFSYPLVKQGILRYIKFYSISFSISNDIEYLKQAVLELTDGIGTKGLFWSAYEAYIPTAKMRDAHIATIKRLDPSYAPPPPTPIKSGCFIATACYGDYEHPIVVELRRFRDEILTPTQIGRLFVDWYSDGRLILPAALPKVAP